MEQERLVTTEAPLVRLQVQGNLHLEGWAEHEVLAQAPDGAEISLTGASGEVHLSCDDTCHVRVPRGSTVHLEMVEGHARIRRVEGAIQGKTVEGHLTLRGVGPVQVEGVEGHCSAEDVQGDLALGGVEGHLSVRGVRGALTVNRLVEGHLSLDDVLGHVQVTAEGHAVLFLDPQPEQQVQVKAEGFIRCALPPEADVHVEIEADTVRVRLPGVKLPEPEDGMVAFTLGAGSARLHLASENYVAVHPVDFDGEASPADWEAFGEQIAARMSHLGEEIAGRVQTRLSARLAEVEGHLYRGGWGKSWMFDMPRRGSRRRRHRSRWTRPRGGVSEEEQRLILEMLAEGKISAEEADRLLQALEEA